MVDFITESRLNGFFLVLKVEVVSTVLPIVAAGICRTLSLGLRSISLGKEREILLSFYDVRVGHGSVVLI